MGNQAGIIIRNVKNELFHSAKRLILNEVKGIECLQIIRAKYHRDPLNGDFYMFMSKDQTKVKKIHYENHAYYVHEKCFSKVILWKR